MMGPFKIHAAALLVSLAAVACTRAHGFRDDGYYQDVRIYRMARDRDTGFSPTSQWYVENYQVDSSGEFVRRKVGPAYQHTFYVDADGDGQLETKVTLPRYDVSFRNRKNDGHIWVSTLPMSAEYAETELRVLALNYVDAVSGAGQLVIDLGDARAVARERRFATRVLEAAPGALDGTAAYDVTFEIANVDQLQLSPDSRWERARIIFVRPHFKLRHGDGRFPALIMIGYRNRPEDFDGGTPAFLDVLGRLQLLSSHDRDRLRAGTFNPRPTRGFRHELDAPVTAVEPMPSDAAALADPFEAEAVRQQAPEAIPPDGPAGH
jgi:hypothetical protein